MRAFRFPEAALTLLLMIGLALIGAGCSGGGDDASRNDDLQGPYPTTLDRTIQVVETPPGSGRFLLESGPGEAHILRNDLDALPDPGASQGPPLSLGYFFVLTDIHTTDEESPTRLSLFDSNTLLSGLFGSAWRPQEDLTPHLLNAITRAANRIAADRGRDFDLAFLLGDLVDNGQTNELNWVLDVLDGTGLSSGRNGVCRPDSGLLDLDPATGMNRGERNFGIQETNAMGENINPFYRPGYPNSNADFTVTGLLKGNGEPLPWFTLVGNHDVLSTGIFEPDSSLTFFTRDDFVGDVARIGFQLGLPNMIQYVEENPGEPLYVADGIFRTGWSYSGLVHLLDLFGMVPEDYREEVNPNFDLLALQHDTPEDPSDDGVEVVPDAARAFLDRDGYVRTMHQAGHGFADNNNDGAVNGSDGGYYTLDIASASTGEALPLRFVALDTTDVGLLSEGGLSGEQLDWLKGVLDQAILDRVLVIVLSHHPSGTLGQGGGTLSNLLSACPNVILHLAGHTHVHRIRAMASGNRDPVYGYWQVETASMVDFPHQGRIVEILDNRDGTGSILLTLFDHSVERLNDLQNPAAMARHLAVEDASDYTHEPGTTSDYGGMGTREDRNVELLFTLPEDVAQDRAGLPGP